MSYSRRVGRVLADVRQDIDDFLDPSVLTLLGEQRSKIAGQAAAQQATDTEIANSELRLQVLGLQSETDTLLAKYEDVRLDADDLRVQGELRTSRDASELAKLKQQCHEYAVETREKKRRVQQVEAEKELLRCERDELKGEKENAKGRFEEALADLERSESEKRRLETELQCLQGDLAAVSASRDSLAALVPTAPSEAVKTTDDKAEIVELNREIARLKLEREQTALDRELSAQLRQRHKEYEAELTELRAAKAELVQIRAHALKLEQEETALRAALEARSTALRDAEERATGATLAKHDLAAFVAAAASIVTEPTGDVASPSDLSLAWSKLQSEISTLRRDRTESQKKLEEALQRERHAQSEIRQFRASLASMQARCQEQQLELHKAQDESATLSARIGVVREEQAKLCRQRDDLVEHSQALKIALDELRGDLAKRDSTQHALEQTLRENETQIEDLRKQLHETDNALASTVAGNETLRKEMEEQRRRLTDAGGMAVASCKEQYEQRFVRIAEDEKASLARCNESLARASERAILAEERLRTIETEIERSRALGERATEEAGALRLDLGQARAEVSEVCNGQRSLEKELTDSRHQLAEERIRLQGTVELLEHQKAALEGEVQLKQERLIELTRTTADRDVQSTKISGALEACIRDRDARLEEREQQLAEARAKCADAQAEINAQQQRNAEIQTQLEQVELQCRNSTGSHAHIEGITALEIKVDKLLQKGDAPSDVAQYENKIRKLEEQLASSEIRRRELHNNLQELTGNIRVFCRTRPPSRPEHACLLALTDGTKLCVTHAGRDHNFSFDKVFGPSAAQEDLFNEVSSMVQSALDGYKVCIFAYGQTGSGKTYTMQGDKSSLGLIPRSLRQVFNTAEDMREKGWDWTLKVSFLEVYNETLQDLLRDEVTRTTPQCLDIKHDDNGDSVVPDLTRIEVTSMQHINYLMAKANKLRVVGCTDQNAQSSRSHSIFTLYLDGTTPSLDQQRHGALHLVDLAGSERLDKSNSSGDRLKETGFINKSLSSLVDIFDAKARGLEYVPFRNSKLTHLMEPCLSGHGKTLMTVNVRSDCESSHETLCSLRFASQVSQCNTGGKAKRNVTTKKRGGGDATVQSRAAPSNSLASGANPNSGNVPTERPSPRVHVAPGGESSLGGMQGGKGPAQADRSENNPPRPRAHAPKDARPRVGRRPLAEINS